MNPPNPNLTKLTEKLEELITAHNALTKAFKLQLELQTSFERRLKTLSVCCALAWFIFGVTLLTLVRLGGP